MTDPDAAATGPGPRVYVVEDDATDRALLTQALETQGYRVGGAGTFAAARTDLTDTVHDIVLLDLQLPDGFGLDLLEQVRPHQPHAQFIIITAYASVDTAVDAMRRGAFDYVSKPIHIDVLFLAIERALERTALDREMASLRRRASEAARSDIVGQSPAIQRVFDLIERVAPTRSSVLLAGPTGTGKELVARAVHRLSPRANRPMVVVNCAAFAETLLESELFGHVKGAFTGAVADHRGLFEEADASTLYLDEISTIGPAMQVKLLRVLQERLVKPVGASREIPVNFRLIAASNTDLDAEVRAGRFREDLFYRLNVFPIRVPPLAERRSDIPILAAHFRARFAQANGLTPAGISPETMARMMAYDWPGNVRELENFIERAMLVYEGEPSIRFDLGDTDQPSAWPAASTIHRTLADVEREHILATLEQTGGNRSQAADLLGIDRRTLYRKLQSYDLPALSTAAADLAGP